jgi:hypothetical protein
MDVGELTSAKTTPYLIALSTDFSIDPLISGRYSLSNPSSSWSDERRASVFADIISLAEMDSGKGTNGIICGEE